ncbi:MAG: prepilin-type N-terminal cleavage/methylation domain-containing protein [Deltaproteobacteria bacterium]|nr:prepilin-type N-terminal cleavage/methylation domain-containing protein [Deltaproteobacteria bacterium]
MLSTKTKTAPREPSRAICRSNSGFTLFEILIAIFIFALVIATVFGSYNFVFSNAEGMVEGVSTYEMAKNCLDRMTIDLRSGYVAMPPAYTPPEMETPPDDHRIVGEIVDVENVPFSRLRFTALSHLLLEGNVRDGIAEIYYYVQPSEDGGFVLKRSDNLYPYPSFEENAADPVLCENVKSITFLFYDQEGAEYDIWDSDSDAFGYATPRAIRIRLEVGGESATHLFETMVTIPVYREKMND